MTLHQINVCKHVCLFQVQGFFSSGYFTYKSHTEISEDMSYNKVLQTQRQKQKNPTTKQVSDENEPVTCDTGCHHSNCDVWQKLACNNAIHWTITPENKRMESPHGSQTWIQLTIPLKPTKKESETQNKKGRTNRDYLWTQRPSRHQRYVCDKEQ